ncbi:YciI family protein [Treponema pedis]|uniref:YciI family protein n=1 Tax=Treponema pedis TaxID=409322 RepID=A0A7S6WMT5_9SPIR|nr:YciI family protein [Treponema pedis]QOW60038.1 YciI family protein [Treponema pedis]
MKKYVVILSGKKKNTLTESLLKEHVEHLKDINKKGKLFICGPLVNSDKAIKIINAASMDEAVKIAQSDPFTVNAYYPNIEILELEEANERNEYLLKA